MTNMTSNESWDTIGQPPLVVAVDYHNDRGIPSLEQASNEGLLFMTRPHLIESNFQIGEGHLGTFQVDQHANATGTGAGATFTRGVLNSRNLLSIYYQCKALAIYEHFEGI